VTEASDSAHWARVADEWIAWARAPGHDEFWSYREALRTFVGQGEGEAVDVGCGEGRVSRLLMSCGYRVTAVDPVAAFVEAARAEGSADAYAIAPAAALPFEEGRFDLAVAYNMLMDVEDVPAALREIARVLRPDGTLVASIVHPFIDRGRFEGDGPECRFVVERAYFGRERFEGVDEREGLRMRFAGWSQPLDAYAAAIAGAGFAITALAEPVPDLAIGGERMERWTRLPLFLWLKARRLP
jgi:SAM-dependent methyltransferase